MLVKVFLESTKIITLVFVLMVLIEWLSVRFQDKLKRFLSLDKRWQIISASLLGTIPGCVDAFFVVSLYSHGLVGFGALAAVMLSTAGDEAFVMLATDPKMAITVFVVCMLLGIIGGYIADKIAQKLALPRDGVCQLNLHPEKNGGQHFFKERVYSHIIKQHLPKLFLWIFLTLLGVQLLMSRFDLAQILPRNRLFLIILAALIGIIPESGPHLIFITLYSQGLIPFSVLLVSTLSQDGHGLLPLISVSLKETAKVQIFTTVFSLLVGIILCILGI
ncbi:arsenic efflux protein [Patescibacteria group bacterium]|nr:arsenic efflux protein [Patescibacteria group bacterium]MBU1867952.1 arsenic efflux protein [Patescibacteria group bacterium]